MRARSSEVISDKAKLPDQDDKGALNIWLISVR